jgi:predicted metalloendopeptidase
VNASYYSLWNAIELPAAMLQAPFFDPCADPAVNYGAIGSIIAHELAHAFDDQRSRFDSRGVLRDWWRQQSRERFSVTTRATGAI